MAFTAFEVYGVLTAGSDDDSEMRPNEDGREQDRRKTAWSQRCEHEDNPDKTYASDPIQFERDNIS
jgi:hypothetical protein